MSEIDPLFFTTSNLGTHQVPGFWQFMLPEDFHWLKYPSERLSSCKNCPNVAFEGYLPDTKCCTYHPNISNFALGFALMDKKSEPVISSAIDIGFTIPEGSQISPKLWAMGIEDDNISGFGKSEVIVCPFLDRKGAMCQIYPYRNSICSSFFCKSNHGRQGFEHWDKIQEFVGQIEAAISQWALIQVGFDLNEYIKKFDIYAKDISKVSDEKNNGWSQEVQKDLFGKWHNKKKDLFIECAKAVNKNKKDLYEIACNHTFVQPEKFETAKFNILPPDLAKNLSAHGPVLGKPTPIGDLWYRLQASHKNLWGFPTETSQYILSERVTIEKNPKNEKISDYYSDLPFRLIMNRSQSAKTKTNDSPDRVIRYISTQEKAILQSFKECTKINQDLFRGMKFSEGESLQTFIVEWKNLGVLISSDSTD